MKTYIIPAVLAIFILAGCSSTKKASDYDDVYYSARQTEKKKATQEMQTSDPDYYVQSEDNPADYKMEDYEAGDYVSYEDEPMYTESETYESPDGNTYITNNYYGAGGYGDYYDYSYSARINRFYSPYYGFNYYSPWYVGFYYDPWYNPYWCTPSLYFGMSWGWGWGSFGWGYPYYGYPYYYHPYNSYWYGYNHGYWDGYYASHYYYDYGNSAYYYGPRTSRSSNSSYRSSALTASHAKETTATTYSERNRPIFSSGTITRPVTGSRSDEQTVVSTSRDGKSSVGVVSKPVDGVAHPDGKDVVPRNAAGAAAVAGNAAALKTERSTQDVSAKPSAQETKPRYSYKKPASAQSTDKALYKPGSGIESATRTQPVQKYSKPGNFNTDRNVSKSRNTSASQRSALYAKPKSNVSDNYSRPSQSNNRYSQPSRAAQKNFSQPSRSNTRSYAQPSRSSSNYSRPATTGSSRSSYSRPSSSGSNRSSSGTRSYSAPSRSSSGGSSTRSSGGGSSRGRR